MSSSRAHINEHNRAMIERFRVNGGRLTDSGMPLVLITHVGRTSGRKHTNPLACAMDGDDLIIAATMGGLPENPQWYRNISAHPRVTVEWNGTRAGPGLRPRSDAWSSSRNGSMAALWNG